VRLPSFSIVAKLYAIFALLATATVALAVVAVLNARRHAALNPRQVDQIFGKLDAA
jgi:methyl-accepting chemotaxis protein